MTTIDTDITLNPNSALATVAIRDLTPDELVNVAGADIDRQLRRPPFAHAPAAPIPPDIAPATATDTSFTG